MEEREGFEPSVPWHNCFRDSRNKPDSATVPFAGRRGIEPR